jgi:hypothetical protein
MFNVLIRRILLILDHRSCAFLRCQSNHLPAPTVAFHSPMDVRGVIVSHSLFIRSSIQCSVRCSRRSGPERGGDVREQEAKCRNACCRQYVIVECTGSSFR